MLLDSADITREGEGVRVSDKNVTSQLATMPDPLSKEIN